MIIRPMDPWKNHIESCDATQPSHENVIVRMPIAGFDLSPLSFSY